MVNDLTLVLQRMNKVEWSSIEHREIVAKTMTISMFNFKAATAAIVCFYMLWREINTCTDFHGVLFHIFKENMTHILH